MQWTLPPVVSRPWSGLRDAPVCLAIALRDMVVNAPASIRPILPGLLFVIVLAAVARGLAFIAAPLAFTAGIEVIVGMLLGLVLANAVTLPKQVGVGAKFASQRILRLGIILLGARFSLGDVAVIGFGALGLVVVCMAVVFLFAMVVGRRLGLPPRVALLIGVGTAVCGNSAILATAPVVKAEDREISFAVATITLFGTLAVFLYPLVGHTIGLDVLSYGLWSGVAVNDTAQAVAAGAGYSSVARDVASVVKLVRNTFMAPLILLIAWWWSRQPAATEITGKAARSGALKAFPLFVLGFLAMALLRSTRILDPLTIRYIDEVTKVCFLLALTGLGLHTFLGQVWSVGPRPFILALSSATLLSVGSLSLILGLHLAPARTVVEPEPVESSVAGAPTQVHLTGRVLAVGVTGAGAIGPVGTFHPGGPIRNNREFAALAQPGQVLDPTRLLVASSSNYGAPLGREGWAPGSILSLATDASQPVIVRPDLAGVPDPSGLALIYTAQSPNYMNRLSTPRAVTADYPAVSNPLAISINNAFGRPWFANSPEGPRGVGLSTVLDPNGRPLLDAPSVDAGGVFAGALTNRVPQIIAGSIDSGAIGTAFLGASPDGTGKAVFAVVSADGAITQVQVERGVDGLAPAGTITAVAESGLPSPGATAARAGIVFNWIPDPLLYVVDSQRNALVQLRLRADGDVFRVVETHRFDIAQLQQPVDAAPAVPEVANPSFSSNTTLAGGADLYVANKADGTIVRIRQDGTVVATADVEIPGLGRVGPQRLNGIAVSPDARKIWITLAGEHPDFPQHDGLVVELAAFGPTGVRTDR